MKTKNRVVSIAACMVIALVWVVTFKTSSNRQVGSPVNEVTVATSASPEQEAFVSERIVDAVATAEEMTEVADGSASEFTTLKGAESLPQTEQQSLWKAFSDARTNHRSPVSVASFS